MEHKMKLHENKQLFADADLAYQSIPDADAIETSTEKYMSVIRSLIEND